MRTYIVLIIALSTTACTGLHQDSYKVHLDRHCRTSMNGWCHSEYRRLQEERMDRIEAKAESRGKEL